VAANGYRVVDLGTSVHSTRVMEAIKEHKPVAVLCSSLMTSTRSAFLETADLLAQEGMEVPLIIGGGAIDGAFAGQRENIRYAKDPRALVGCWMRSLGLKEMSLCCILFYCLSGTNFHSFSRARIISIRRDGRIYRVDLPRRSLKRSIASRSVLRPMRTLRINMPIVP